MEKEFKIAELALYWCVSVPTCWNRIKKEGLITFKKKDETNKDITYVRISDEIINKYVINDVNNINNNNNNGYYEELLTFDNINNNVNNAKNPLTTNNLVDDLIKLNKSYNDDLKTVYNDFNEKIEKLQEELVSYKSKIPLLEDKAGREGFYISENNKLLKQIETQNNEHKKVIESKNKLIKWLITLIITLFIVIITFLTYSITVYNFNNYKTENPSIEQVLTVENVDKEN